MKESLPVVPPIAPLVFPALQPISSADASSGFRCEVKRLPHYPIRAILIGRLARDERCMGMGIGEHLLDYAHRRALRINAEIGGLIVIVDAKNARAAAFYKRYGYEPLIQSEADADPWPQRLYMTMATLRQAYVGTSP